MDDLTKAETGGEGTHHGTAQLVTGIVDMGAAMFGVSEALHATYPPVGSALHRLADLARTHAHWIHRTEPPASGGAVSPSASPVELDPGQLTDAEWEAHHAEASRKAETLLDDLSRHPEVTNDPRVAAAVGNLADKLSEANRPGRV